jgi:glycosyltransferase involved in cell wall biosynthesis
MKGHPFFLEAAARVAQSFPDSVFAITGTGEPEYTAALHRQAQELGIGRRVRFLGTVTDMPRFYRACDVACVPSASEPFGRTVIEAFAVGTPVVATAVGGIQETIEDDVTGLLVSYGNVDLLADRVERVLGDTALRSRLSISAANRARERYSADRYAAAVARVVQIAAKDGRFAHGRRRDS